MSKKAPVSRSLREVWAWKEASYREVADLPTRTALREIVRRAQAEARALGFTPSAQTQPAKVAETSGKYAAKNADRKQKSDGKKSPKSFR